MEAVVLPGLFLGGLREYSQQSSKEYTSDVGIDTAEPLVVTVLCRTCHNGTVFECMRMI